MRLSEFDFDLPEELIAVRPARPRSSARMLVANGSRITDARVSDLPGCLRAGDRLVLNDTRVIPARLSGVRHRGSGTSEASEARIEATLLEPQSDGTWSALLKPLKKVRDGEAIRFSEALSAVVESRRDGTAILRFNLTAGDFDAALALAGAMPLPPYIVARRPADALDVQDYQAIWAARTGAVAAPTASLHFDDALMTEIERIGVDITYVTLHVGAGTFLPVKVDDISEHRMHAEWGEVSVEAASEINDTLSSGGRIVPVGTTALRLLETAAVGPGQIGPWSGNTDIFIRPGFTFRIADGLMTNFHLPKSTLMMLVSAFLGRSEIRAVYEHAVAERYRFFSYGDASLLWPARGRDTSGVASLL